LQNLLPEELLPHAFAREWPANFDAVLLSDARKMTETLNALSQRPGPIVQVFIPNPKYRLFHLVKEKTVSNNTAAAGGNASLMMLGK
jgi:RHH-type transcriptional regulator, proline utilization regulon repressor / proline dehydrogenase / delta 1-pyrroline-5-carboxylate dehydrogenase